MIEIVGAGFVNKGAELMLHAVLNKTRAEIPDVSFVVSPSANDDYIQRAELGLLQKVSFQRYGIQWGRLGRFIPRFLRQRYGMIVDEEIDVVFDMTGFAYGDQWGERNVKAMASNVKRWKKNGTKVVFLPQALGPFSSRSIRESFKSIVDNADLIFPRDTESYGYVVDVAGDCDCVSLAPDFTNLLSGTYPEQVELFQGKYCIVPNAKMIDKTRKTESEQYVPFLVNCIQAIVKNGQTPFFLIHEGDDDLHLAEKVCLDCGHQFDIVQEKDPLRVKGILGVCGGVISSRYHGLVSALSQGVPALATGWSHKYQMLFEEYSISDSCIPVALNANEIEQHIKEMIDVDSRKPMVAKISASAEKYRLQSELMWQKTFNVIKP